MTGDTRARLLLGLGWFTAATFVGFAVLARFPVPYRDDWEWLAWIVEEPPSLRRLFLPHNEHLIPLARLLVWLQDAIAGVNGRVLFTVGLTAEAIIVAVFWREIHLRWPDDRLRRRSALGVALVLLSFAWQLQSVVFAAAILFPLVQVFAALAFSATAAAATGAGLNRWRSIAGSLLAGVGAVLTTTNGVAVPAVAALVAGSHRRTRALGAAHAGLALVGVILFVVLVLGTRTVRASGALSSFDDWPVIVLYFFAFFAPFVTAASEPAGAVVGLVVVATGIAAIGTTWRSGGDAPRIERFAAAMMVFVMVSAALAAAGRASEYGAGQAAQSRYATLTVSYWAVLVVAVMSQADRGAAPAMIRHAGRYCAAAAVPAAVVFIAVHLVAGMVWVAKAGNVATAGLAMAAGVRDDTWIRSLHSSPAFVYDLAARAEARGDRTLTDPHVGRQVRLDPTLPDCGAILTIETTPDGRAHRLGGRGPRVARAGWVIDANGVVIGLARPAPLVDAPAPTPRDVAAVVGQAIAGGTWPGGDRWVGFARADAPPPLAIVGLAAGRPTCRSAIR